jgi:hypothetical protein
MEGKASANPSARVIYYLLFAQFLAQFFTFFYLYVYVTRVEQVMLESVVSPRRRSDCAFGREIGSSSSISNVRRKRNTALPATEDNAVSEVFRVSFLRRYYANYTRTGSFTPCINCFVYKDSWEIDI